MWRMADRGTAYDGSAAVFSKPGVGDAMVESTAGTIAFCIGAEYGFKNRSERSVLSLRCNQNIHSVVLFDFYHQLHPELFSAGAKQKNFGKISRRGGKHHGGSTGGL